MPRRSILSEEEKTEMNLSPMIDCIFILLIFFIVTTVFVEEQGIQVDKPDAAAADPMDDSESIVFEITADGRVLLDDREVAISDVATDVKSRIEGDETPVSIRAHEKSHHGTFVAVWDAARRGGARSLSFTTIN